MIELLRQVFECLLLMFCSLFLLAGIIAIVKIPFDNAKRKKNAKEFAEKIDKLAKECIEELKKEQENIKETTKKKAGGPRKNKEK